MLPLPCPTQAKERLEWATRPSADRLAIIGGPGVIDACVDDGQRSGDHRRAKLGIAHALQGRVVPLDHGIGSGWGARLSTLGNGTQSWHNQCATQGKRNSEGKKRRRLHFESPGTYS